jgi:uncharacterized protein YbjT (DUF2867 family)
VNLSIKKVLVTGATGNIGGAIFDAFDQAGINAVAGVRDPGGYLAQHPSRQAIALDFENPSTFAPALEDVDSIFLMRPPAIAKVGPTINRFLNQAGLGRNRRVTFLSVEGAGSNPVVPHHRIEKHLFKSRLDYTVLRPGFFSSNLGDAYRDEIRTNNRVYVPAAQGRVAFVNPSDVADVAVLVEQDRTAHSKQIYTLTGSTLYSFDEVALLLSSLLGRNIHYEAATARGYAKSLRASGLPAAQIAVQTILHLNLRREKSSTVNPTMEQLLGRPSRPLRDYINSSLDRWSQPKI